MARSWRQFDCCLFWLSLILLAGCSWDVNSVRRVASIAKWGSTAGVEVRRRPKNPLERQMRAMRDFWGNGNPKPTPRSVQYLRRNALFDAYRDDPGRILKRLANSNRDRPDLERLSVLAELSYVEGKRVQRHGNEQAAGQLFSTSAIAAYQFLFDPQLDLHRNAYDPLFREVCDIYNASLDGMLRIMRDQETLRPGGTFTASTLGGEPLKFVISLEGRHRNETFEKFEFASDYDTQGLRNNYHTYGLGVPLIGVRAQDNSGRTNEQYYPPGLALPLTAFIRVLPVVHPQGDGGQAVQQCALQLFDPLEQTEVRINGRYAPLESDISTPLAYYLDDPLLSTNWFATVALLNGDFAKRVGGLYMLEPYDPSKIPVVMVHGFWSSPMTWTEMFNDLRGDPRIRDHYQFWFYLYPSGQPFWFSARQMRQDLMQARQALDPQRQSVELDKMVLVGHSMGGLISLLQTYDSDDRFWGLVSDRSIETLQGDEAAIAQLRDTLFFQANPSVSRVVTLGTPHRGSNFANSLTRWFGHQFFRLPSNLTNQYKSLVDSNTDFFSNPELLTINTSIDSLDPNSPFFSALDTSRRSRHVRQHNVIGIYETKGLSKWFAGSDDPSDGVVSVSSASRDDVVSEIQVNAEHSVIHQHPQAILEVRRILMEHLDEIQESPTTRNGIVQPAGFDVPVDQASQWNSQRQPSASDPRYDRGH